ncbi:MAG: rhomboid family intramembrane serine protease [Alteromonadaceae bacterium]|nr:MAG: rhomboid family intramembrane serine protease [Alteromonadaceae bacterium]
MCLAIVVIHFINSQMMGGALSVYGIHPRSLYSLPYIYTSPWLHGSWLHVLSNLVGFAVLSGLCLLRGIPFYLKSSAIIITITGILVWIFARPAVHIGASGWVFGLWSLSMALAWFQRSFLNILIALFVLVFYGGMVFGMMPGNRMISFESHIFGALAGVICAYIMTRSSPKVSKKS